MTFVNIHYQKKFMVSLSSLFKELHGLMTGYVILARILSTPGQMWGFLYHKGVVISSSKG